MLDYWHMKLLHTYVIYKGKYWFVADIKYGHDVTSGTIASLHTPEDALEHIMFYLTRPGSSVKHKVAYEDFVIKFPPDRYSRVKDAVVWGARNMQRSYKLAPTKENLKLSMVNTPESSDNRDSGRMIRATSSSSSLHIPFLDASLKRPVYATAAMFDTDEFYNKTLIYAYNCISTPLDRTGAVQVLLNKTPVLTMQRLVRSYKVRTDWRRVPDVIGRLLPWTITAGPRASLPERRFTAKPQSDAPQVHQFHRTWVEKSDLIYESNIQDGRDCRYYKILNAGSMISGGDLYISLNNGSSTLLVNTIESVDRVGNHTNLHTHTVRDIKELVRKNRRGTL